MEKAYLENQITLIDELLSDESVPSQERNFARERRKELGAMLDIVVEKEREEENARNLIIQEKEKQKQELISASRETLKQKNAMRNKIITRDINHYKSFR